MLKLGKEEALRFGNLLRRWAKGNGFEFDLREYSDQTMWLWVGVSDFSRFRASWWGDTKEEVFSKAAAALLSEGFSEFPDSVEELELLLETRGW